MRHSRKLVALDHSHGVLDWLVSYLLNKGGNEELARGLQTQSVRVLSPRLYPLSLMRHFSGRNALTESLLEWNRRVGDMQVSLRNGWKPVPIITVPKSVSTSSISSSLSQPTLLVVDGNHTHEALLREGVDCYETITVIGLEL